MRYLKRFNESKTQITKKMIRDLFSIGEDIFFTHYIAYQRFIQSLDYNWVKGSSRDPKIDLFRLREAMNEFDIDLVEMLRGFDKYHNSIGPYKYVGLDGERINIFGDRI